MISLTALTVISIASLVVSLGIVGVKAVAVKSAFNAVGDMLSLGNVSQMKLFDQGPTGIIAAVCTLFGGMVYVTQMLVILGAFLCIVFHAFKLWAGTTELKKTFIDIVYKGVIVMFAMAFYPQIITSTYTWATELGVKASGGPEYIVSNFAVLAKNTSEVFKNGTKDLVTALQNSGAKKEGDSYVISENTLKIFTDTGMTKDEAKQWAEQNGLKVGDSGAKGWWMFANEQQKKESAAMKQFKGDSKWGRNNKINYMKQNLAILRTLNEVLTGVDEVSMREGELSVSDLLSLGEDSLKSVFFNPFVENSNNRLSISTMMKTAIIVSAIVSSGALAPYDDTVDYDGNFSDGAVTKSLEGQNKKTRWIVKFLGWLMKLFVFKLAMVLGVLIIMMEYTITLIEFLVVGACSTLLIPMFFLDATKQYATNIVKMIFSYFMKIMVVTMMCFFILGQFIRLGSSMYAMDMGSIITFVYYLFNIILGVVLVKNCGKVAMAVISGNPSLGIGELAHEFRGIGHAMNMGMRMAQHAAHDVQKVGHAAQGAVGNGAAIANGFKAGSEARLNAENSLRGKVKSKEIDMSEKDIAKAGRQAANDARGTYARDVLRNKAHKMVFGTDRMFHDEKGNRTGAGKGLTVGQKYIDKDGFERTATIEEVRQRNKELAKNSADKIVDKAIRVKKGEDKPETSTFDKLGHPTTAPGEEPVEWNY